VEKRRKGEEKGRREGRMAEEKGRASASLSKILDLPQVVTRSKW